MKKFALLLVAALMIPGVVVAGSCPNLMNQIDTFLAEKPDLDEETIVDEETNQNVRELREEGETLHKSGDHAESVRVLQKALDLLKGNG